MVVQYVKYGLRTLALVMVLRGLPLGHQILMHSKAHPTMEGRTLTLWEAACVVPGMVGCIVLLLGGIAAITFLCIKGLKWIFTN